MTEGLVSNLSAVLFGNIWLALLMAFAAGLISSFSPCVLASVPLVVAYVGGYAGNDRKRAFIYSLFFCMGLALTFTALGAASAMLGKLMTGTGRWWYLVLGVIMTAVGLEMLGVIQIMPQVCHAPAERRGVIGAFVLGIMGGIFSSPCATPVLVAILAFVAGEGNIALGIALLAVYSIGHCALLLLAGTSVGFVQKLFSSPKTEKWGRILKILFGLVVIILALYLFYLGF